MGKLNYRDGPEEENHVRFFIHLRMDVALSAAVLMIPVGRSAPVLIAVLSARGLELCRKLGDDGMR